jgi:DNA-binding NtrC family response regulator
MSIWEKRILIIDEKGFSRVCSAILELEGYKAETVTDPGNLPSRLNSREFGLIITSYPYGASLSEEIKDRNIPVIILSDHIGTDLIDTLKDFGNSYCMIKPLDYGKFKFLVRQLMSDDINVQGGYNIV